MKTAIEVLERSLKSHTNTRNLWADDKEEDLSEEVADFDRKIAEVKAAIDHLQRKSTNESIIEIPSDEKIEEVSKAYNNSMTSIAEGIWVPQGFIYGAQWMRDKLTPHLQHKIKKDPRVDGLPPVEPNGMSLPLIIWTKNTTLPLVAKMHNRIWYEQNHIDYRIFSTYEILFYADPNEIL